MAQLNYMKTCCFCGFHQERNISTIAGAYFLFIAADTTSEFQGQNIQMSRAKTPCLIKLLLYFISFAKKLCCVF